MLCAASALRLEFPMKQIDATVFFRPPTESQRYLPEGPYRCPDGQVAWVAIQHGADSLEGSLNLLDLATGENQQFNLPGRPGFAFPTVRLGTYILGIERSLVWFHTDTSVSEVIAEGIDREINDTIINDGVVFDGHLVFGCKDLKFADKIAGLYLLRAGETEPVKLRGAQICSNGKAVVCHQESQYTLYDIDSPTKQVVAWQLDVDEGSLTRPKVIVDLTNEPVFPDGMILTPDQLGLIVAIYDPRDSDHGEAREYDLESGQLKTVWRCPKSPRVTCPQLIQRADRTELLLTTADEGMSAEQREQNPEAGCLFLAETDFEGLNANPLYPV
jgi:sugar lactone lactonase YvrE